MTAQRWWVRLFARWQARVDAVKGQIQAVSLSITALSTFSLVLKGTVLQPYIPAVWVLAVVVGPAYAYYYAEGGVWNQVSRDRADMSTNYAGPNGAINAELLARTLAAVEKGDELTEREREAARSERDEAFAEYRDGMELEQ